MDNSDSSSSSEYDTCGEIPINSYDLSRAIATDSDVMDLLSENARYFFKFSLHGPHPVMFYQYKHPLRLNGAVNTDAMRSSLNSFIMRKSKEEARIIFYNGEAKRQVQQAATNMDAETNYRLTLRKHVDMYGMESAAAELNNFMLTTCQRVRRELNIYTDILTSASDQHTLATLRFTERSILELSYVALLRKNISLEYELFLVDRLLASIGLEAAATGASDTVGFFSLESAIKTPFLRPKLIDCEISPPVTDTNTAPDAEPITKVQNHNMPTEPPIHANITGDDADHSVDNPIPEKISSEALTIQILMDSNHTTFQLFTEYIEKLVDSIGGNSVVSDLASYYDTLSMYADLLGTPTDSNNNQDGKAFKSTVSSQKDGVGTGTRPKSAKNVVAKDDINSVSNVIENVTPNSLVSRPLPAFLSRYETCRMHPNIFNPKLSVLFHSSSYQKNSSRPLIDFADIIGKIIMNSTSSTRRPSVTIAPKVHTRGASPSTSKRSPSSTTSSKKSSYVPSVQDPVSNAKEPSIDIAAILPEEYSDYNQLLEAFKHIYHFYQYCIQPSRDVKLLRCNVTDPNFSLSEYIRSLATNGQNNLSQTSIADAAFFVELSSMLSRGSLDSIDLFADLLHPEQTGTTPPSSLPVKQKGSAERPKSKVPTPPGSRVELEEYSSNVSHLLESLSIELISVGDLVNYFRFLNTFIGDSYEVRARKSLLKEIQDMVLLELWKTDNDTESIRNYLINKNSIPYATLDNNLPDCQTKAPEASKDENYFTSLLTNLNNKKYLKTLIDKIDLIFVTGDPVSGKTLITTELSRRLSGEKKISTGIVDACSIYHSLYEELMRILDNKNNIQSHQNNTNFSTVYLEDELMSELLTLHNDLLYMQLANAQPGSRFYPHPLHNPKSLSDGLILNSNSMASCTNTNDLNTNSIDSPINSLHQRVPGRSTLRDELPVDIDTFSSQDISRAMTGDITTRGVRVRDPSRDPIRHNTSSKDNFLTPNDVDHDGSLFSQNEGEAIDEQSDSGHKQSVRFNIPTDIKTMLHTPEQYIILYRAIQRRVRKCLLSRTEPNGLSVDCSASSADVGDQSSEIHEIEKVDNYPDDLTSIIECILSGKDHHTSDNITIDVTDPHQINRFVTRSMLVQSITQSLLSNYVCLIFDGFPNSVYDIDVVEDLLNGCLTKGSLQRLLNEYTARTISTSDKSIGTTVDSCMESSLDNPLMPVFIKRSGITSLIYLHDNSFESICRRLYGRLFISSHPVESDNLLDVYLTNCQTNQSDAYNTDAPVNDTQLLLKDTELDKISTFIDEDNSMTDDTDNPKKQYLSTITQNTSSSHKQKDYTMSSESDFSSSTSMDYSSDVDDSTDPDCERIRKKFPIGSDTLNLQHSNVYDQVTPSDVAIAPIHNIHTPKSILYNSRRLNLSADNLAAYGAGLKIPAYEIRNIGFMNSATLDVLNTDPVKSSVLFGEDYARPPAEIPLKPVAQWADIPTRNASKANLSLLSIYTTTSLGFVPWMDEKSDEHLSVDDTFIKSYPIVDPQAYDAFCKAVAQHAVRLSTGCKHQLCGADSPLNEEKRCRPSVAEIFFSYLFFDIYTDNLSNIPRQVALHKHEVVRNLIQLNYENRLLINRVDIELASYKQKRDELLTWIERTYERLQPRVSLPQCIQIDSLFRRSQRDSNEFEVYLAEEISHEEPLTPSVLCICDVNPLFNRPLAAFSEDQSGSVFMEELADVGNRVYHHVLRAIEHRHRTVSSTSYELHAMLPHKSNSKESNTYNCNKNSSFELEFLELYQRELGLQEPSTEYLDYPIPEPPLDATDLKKTKSAPVKAQANKSKVGTATDTSYVALNPLATFNLSKKFFSTTISNALQDITKGYRQRQIFMERSVYNLAMLQSVIADILTHESVGQTDLFTNFYDVSLEHTRATFIEFLNFYKSIDKDVRNQPNIKADALLLIDKCLAQCNDNIFQTKARSDVLINDLTIRYLRLSAKMSLDIFSLSDYKDVISKYLPLLTKTREPGIALGVLLFQYVSYLYDVMLEDIAYIFLILFTLHDVSISAYDSSSNILYDILISISTETDQEALADAYNLQLETLLKGKQVTTAMIGQQVDLLKSRGRVSPPVLIIGMNSLQEHVQQKNQKSYEGYAVSLDPLYSLAKSLAVSSDEHKALLMKMKEKAIVGLGQDPVLTVEEYAHYNYQAIRDYIDQLNDLVTNGMLVSQNAGSTVVRVQLHPVYDMLITRLASKLENKLSFVKQQVQTHIAMCTDGLSSTLLNIEDMTDQLYTSTLSVAASAARAMQTVVDEEIDILDFHIDMAAKRISLEINE